MRASAAALFLCVLAAPARAAEVHVLEIKPTQFAVGMIEVQSRVDKMQAMSHGELKDYLADRPIPVIAGPGGQLYMIDHHHLARAAWEAGVHKVVIERKADYSHMSRDKFWEKMKSESLIYPYDQFGNGPHPPGALPADVRSLADDPYRSLAWRVRDEGGYDKTTKPFSEFQWAEFFRNNLPMDDLNEHFDGAVKKAMDLAKSPAASHLPGYNGAGAR